MAHRKLNSVRQTFTGTGTGALTAGAATSARFRTLLGAGMAVADTTYVRIQHDTIDAEWEVVLITLGSGTITRAFDSKSSSATGGLINFSAGNKTLSTAVVAGAVVAEDPSGNVAISGNLSVGGSFASGTSTFAASVAAAWAADRTLNWQGGDVTLTSPILLQATSGKGAFGIRGNGATISCAYGNTAEHAITIEVPIVSGNVLQNITVRNFTINNMHFTGSGFAGALKMRCLSNGSWIYSFLLNDVTCDGHTGYAYSWQGSVFECIGAYLKSTGGLGGIHIERLGKTLLSTDPDMGLPSAMELHSPNFRDGSADGILMDCPQAFNDPFDLTIRGGYIVTMGGVAVRANSGITMVDGLGIENVNGGAGLIIGYRGGVVKGGTRGANPIAGAAEGGPGMRYLVNCNSLSGRLVLEDLLYENEGSGTNMTLAKTTGTSLVNMNRCGTAAAINNTGCTIVVSTP